MAHCQIFTTIATLTEDSYDPDYLLRKFSSLKKLLRVTALLLRFAKLTSVRDKPRQTMPEALRPDQINTALHRLIQVEQQRFLHDEIEALQRHKQLSRKSLLRSLNPSLNSSGLLCNGARPDQLPIPDNEKHPPILPKESQRAKLLIDQGHRDVLHKGALQTFSYLQRQVWIIRSRNLVKRFIRGCTICSRAKPSLREQLMSQLPLQALSRTTLHPQWRQLGRTYPLSDLTWPWT